MHGIKTDEANIASRALADAQGQLRLAERQSKDIRESLLGINTETRAALQAQIETKERLADLENGVKKMHARVAEAEAAVLKEEEIFEVMPPEQLEMLELLNSEDALTGAGAVEIVGAMNRLAQKMMPLLDAYREWSRQEIGAGSRIALFESKIDGARSAMVAATAAAEGAEARRAEVVKIAEEQLATLNIESLRGQVAELVQASREATLNANDPTQVEGQRRRKSVRVRR